MLQLITPDISHKEQWEEIIKEWGDTQKKPAIFFQDNYNDLLHRFHELSLTDDIIKEIPKSSFYFLADSIENKILWFFWLRHHCDFPWFSLIGWHIGYWIRLSERWKWYAKEWLRLLLDIAKQKDIWERVLLTCDDENISSFKVIESNGGILEKIFEKDGVLRRRYWINLFEEEKKIIKSLELELLIFECRHNPSRIDALLADDFFECGKTGTMFGKKECLESLPEEDRAKTFEATDLVVYVLAENLAQIRYFCKIQHSWVLPTISFRSSLWRKNEKWWQMFYHQWTLIQ